MGSLKSTFQVLTLRMTLFASIAPLMLLTRQRVCPTNYSAQTLAETDRAYRPRGSKEFTNPYELSVQTL